MPEDWFQQQTNRHGHVGDQTANHCRPHSFHQSGNARPMETMRRPKQAVTIGMSRNRSGGPKSVRTIQDKRIIGAAATYVGKIANNTTVRKLAHHFPSRSDTQRGVVNSTSRLPWLVLLEVK